MDALKQKGMKDPKGSKQKLQKLCEKNGIAITKDVQHVKEGWVEKQKGSFQILFERGWTDPNANPKDYTVLGHLNIYRNRCKQKSLKKLLSLQPDFMRQETLLQTFIMKLGQKSDRTPIVHCEIAGEGIEFNWGHSKIIYRSRPIEQKRNKNKFQDLVQSVVYCQKISCHYLCVKLMLVG